MPRLENWEIIHDVISDCCRLVGDVYNHNIFENGNNVTTSRLIEIDFTLKEARTKNTVYDLGHMKNSLQYKSKENQYELD